MSNVKETVAKSTAKLWIVRKVMEITNMGDEGKTLSFFSGLISKIEKKIKILNQNVAAFEIEKANLKSAIADKMEDAQEDLQNAYFDVKMDKIKNKAAQAQYGVTYLANIQEKKNVIENIKKAEEDGFYDSVEGDSVRGTKAIDEDIKAAKEEIANYKETLKGISKK